METRRSRIVPGSCWTCKQKRVKCESARPSCQRCLLAQTSCSYDAVVLLWKDGRASKVLRDQAISELPKSPSSPIAILLTRKGEAGTILLRVSTVATPIHLHTTMSTTPWACFEPQSRFERRFARLLTPTLPSLGTVICLMI